MNTVYQCVDNLFYLPEGLQKALYPKGNILRTIEEDLRKMENDGHIYKFTSTEEGVDYIRIVREAPKGTPFILVEERTRVGNKPIAWSLFVHNDVINNPAVKRFFTFDSGILNPAYVDLDKWGVDSIEYNGETHKLYSYRVVGGEGRFFSSDRKTIESIKQRLNPRSIKTTVTYV